MEVLARLDNNDTQVYDDYQNDHTAKADLDKNIPWMIPQWLTGSYDENQQYRSIMMFDAFCNRGWSVFYKHPELQLKLMSIAGSKGGRHRFYRPVSKKASTDVLKLMDIFLSVYEDIREEEVHLWCRDSTEDDFADLLDQCGIPLNERDTLWKNYKSVKNQ